MPNARTKALGQLGNMELCGTEDVERGKDSPYPSVVARHDRSAVSRGAKGRERLKVWVTTGREEMDGGDQKGEHVKGSGRRTQDETELTRLTESVSAKTLRERHCRVAIDFNHATNPSLDKRQTSRGAV